MKPAALRRELEALRRTARDEAALLPGLPAADEGGALAGEMAAAFGRMVQHYREWYALAPEEARAKARESPPEYLDRVLTGPPDQVSWFDLETIAEQDPAQALRRWEEVKQAAREEVRNGHRAARAIEDGGGGPWERALFSAVRAELAEAWGPRNAVERLLVDQLAQWQVLLWRWQEALTAWTTCATYRPRRAKKGEPYEAMRISEAEALEGAAGMVERIHRLYLRTLKALQELRRVRPPVVVRRAGQVNIGQQQVNVAPR
jgi:hypothetical protein